MKKFILGELNGKSLEKEVQKAADYIIDCLPSLLNRLAPYGKAKACIILHQFGKPNEANAFLRSLKEQMVYTPQMGRYFDNPHSLFEWRDLRISTHVAAMEALRIVDNDSLCMEQMRQWLLMQKQTQSWDNPLNTVDAIHALLMLGTDLLDNVGETTLKMDGKPITSDIDYTSVFNYQKQTYTTEELNTLPKEVCIEKKHNGIAWGAVYAQYLEEINKTTSSYTGHTATDYGQRLDQPLSIERTWMVLRNTDNQSMWIPITSETILHTGDKVRSSLTIRTDRSMDFVQIKENHAACTEPISSTSGYHHNYSIGYYCSVKDASTHYFIDHLPKGTHSIEQTFYIDRTGLYQTGIATIQCAYAPEFVGNTEGMLLNVE